MVSNHGLHPQTWGWGSGLLGVPEALMTGTGPSSWWIPWRDLPPAGWDVGGSNGPLSTWTFRVQTVSSRQGDLTGLGPRSLLPLRTHCLLGSESGKRWGLGLTDLG